MSQSKTIGLVSLILVYSSLCILTWNGLPQFSITGSLNWWLAVARIVIGILIFVLVLSQRRSNVPLFRRARKMNAINVMLFVAALILVILVAYRVFNPYLAQVQSAMQWNS